MFDDSIGQIGNALPVTGLPRQKVSKRHFTLPFVQVAQRDNGLLRQQEVCTAAPCPFNAMGGNAFHLVTGKAERVVFLTVTELQQL